MQGLIWKIKIVYRKATKNGGPKSQYGDRKTSLVLLEVIYPILPYLLCNSHFGILTSRSMINLCKKMILSSIPSELTINNAPKNIRINIWISALWLKSWPIQIPHSIFISQVKFTPEPGRIFKANPPPHLPDVIYGWPLTSLNETTLSRYCNTRNTLTNECNTRNTRLQKFNTRNTRVQHLQHSTTKV